MNAIKDTIIIAILEVKDCIYSKYCKFHQPMDTAVVTFPLMPELLGLRPPLKSSSVISGGLSDAASYPTSTKTNHFGSSTLAFLRGLSLEPGGDLADCHVFRITMRSLIFWSHPLPCCSAALQCTRLGAPGGSRVSVFPGVHSQ